MQWTFPAERKNSFSVATTLTLFLLAILVAGYPVMAQDGRTIRGTVTDQRGNPLPGVTLSVKGTTQATSTDD
ncbi:MAG TPA: hypothetical protein VHC48_00285, partial [Puia sp.]|nr:hypothetical protein [Puia sp.]